MPRNGSGVFSPPGANYPAVSGALITAVNRNAVDADIATALTGSIAVNGESVVTNNIPMAGNKLTGLGAATTATDAATLAQVQSGVSQVLGSVSGVDTITATLSPTLAAYALGNTFRFVSAGANTGAVTININGLGAKAVTKNGSTALAAGDIPSGTVAEIVYDGARFQLNNKPDVATAPFADTTAIVKGSADATKLARFEVDGFTTATTRVFTLQNSDGTLAHVDSQTFTGAPTFPTGSIATTQAVGDSSTKIATTAFVQANKLISGTAIATTSGTSHDFTSIPSWAKRITIMLNGVSTNGTSPVLLQIGDSGGIENTGYLGTCSGVTNAVASENRTTGFGATYSGAHVAAAVLHGSLVITLEDAATNTWTYQGSVAFSNSAAMSVSAGSKPLSATLDRVRLTTVNGTDTFDAGSINILYE